MFPVNTILAWIRNDYHELGNIILTNLLLPLGHISNRCITEQVKRLAGNEIELGIEILTIESRASNIPMQREQRMLLCVLTAKDLRRICRSQYEHLGSAIGY